MSRSTDIQRQTEEVELQLSSVAQSCLTLCDSMHCTRQAFLSITNSQSLLKLMSIELVMPSNHLILCHPLVLPPSIFPSIRVFSNESVFPIRWPKHWNFSFSIRPANEYSGLISFRIDWLDLLAVQGTLKSLHQYHSSKASIFRLKFLQLSHPYLTTGKNIALTGEGNGKPLPYSCPESPMNSMKTGTYLHKIFQSKIV